MNHDVRNSSPDDLAEYWRELNKEIARIEAWYPLITTTLVTLFIGTIAAQNASWFTKLGIVAPYAVPLLALLGLGYVLSLFRRVAVLRGYSAFVEDEINHRHSDRVYLWNSQYVDRFEQNNGPNVLMMLVNLLAVVTAIWASITLFRSSPDLQRWLMRVDNLLFLTAAALILLFALIGFGKNDSVRRHAYRFAKFQNYPELRPVVCVYPGKRSLFDKSGIGRARKNHRRAAELVGLVVTDNLDEPYDILHVSTWGVRAVRHIRRARRRGKKVVVSAHSTEQDFSGSVMFSARIAPLFGRWLKYVYSQADLIVAPSGYAKRRIEELGVHVPAVVISGGVETDVFKLVRGTERRYAFSGTRAVGRLYESRKLVVGVGFTFERKGFADFVDVAKLLDDATFVWCGHVAPIVTGIAVTMRLFRLPKNIVLAGFIRDSKQLAEIYNVSDAFLGLAHEETEGLAVLEALACGTPLVIRDLPAYDERLRTHSGVRVIEHDATVMEAANALAAVLESQAPADRGAVSILADDRSLQSVGAQLKQAYLRLL